MTDPLDEIREDVAELRAWTSRHEESHTADTTLLASIISKIESHATNHHGRASTIKQNTGMMAGVLTVLYVAVELLRRFFL